MTPQNFVKTGPFVWSQKLVSWFFVISDDFLCIFFAIWKLASLFWFLSFLGWESYKWKKTMRKIFLAYDNKSRIGFNPLFQIDSWILLLNHPGTDEDCVFLWKTKLSIFCYVSEIIRKASTHVYFRNRIPFDGRFLYISGTRSLPIPITKKN